MAAWPLPLAAIALCACASPGALPARAPLPPGIRLAPLVPDEAEHAARDVAAAALGADVESAARAALRIEALDGTREGGPTGLAPAAADLVNAAAKPGRAYREAAASLLERDDLDPALRERIERAYLDDPLEHAEARVSDARWTAFARLFNTIAEPVGQSVLTTALAPYRLGRAVIRYGLDLYRADPLPLQRRQALAHWKQFLARYPEDPEHAAVASEVAKAQKKWHRTQRRKYVRSAERALRDDRPNEALHHAERALRHEPDHDTARELRDEAEEALRGIRRAHARSLGFELPIDRALVPAGSHELALALLLSPRDVRDLAGSLSDGPLAPEVRFALAGALAQTGDEASAHDVLDDLADEDGDRTNMVRHAAAELADPIRNPYDTFVRARWRDRGARTSWLLIGPMAQRSYEANLAGVLEFLVDSPILLQVAYSLPLRILQWPWMPPPTTAKVTAVQARRYLALAPRGIHAEETRDWLEDYERARNNYVGALEVAESRGDPGDLGPLREDAARQAYAVALREDRRDLRRALLMAVTRRYPTTEAGDQAGRLVRKEIEEQTPHEIAMTRGFLLENPDVAGVRGLGLDPSLLDGDRRNGEIHDDGVALVGARLVELRYEAPDGDDEEPERRYVELSDAQLARVVSRLEETSFRNALLDDDDALQADATRDLVFERARLGLADDVDDRPTAEASYAYRGLRERYGLVRRREPILPFDIVVRGSLTDLSLGAFPRWRAPKKTTDALLYE